jgi:hypothetical protein
VLGDTPGGRLYKQLVESSSPRAPSASPSRSAEPSPLFIGAALAPTQDVEKARAAMARPSMRLVGRRAGQRRGARAGAARSG